MKKHRTEYRSLDSHRFEKLLPWLFAQAGAGWDISGVSGSGKSNACELLFFSHVRQGHQAFFFDPHGNSAKKLRRMCLELPDRLRQNILYIRPSDTSTTVGINPLAVPREGISEYEWKARLSNKVGHVARILLAAWGESEFGSRPLLRKWVTRWLRTLAFLGLSVADVRHFIDVSSPVYQALVQLVPDLMARHEMAELSHLRLSEREEQIASAKNRFLGLLENPIVEAILGRSDSGVLDMAQLIENGTSVILDLEPAGNLSEEDQQILANLYLTELVHTVMNLPENRRPDPDHPCVVCIDELPVFESSAPLLLRACCEIRKYNLRFFFAHQGTSRFPMGRDNEFLNTITQMCRVHLYFRHVGNDARFFSDMFALETFDPHKIKFELKQPQQYQAGLELRQLLDESESLGESETAGGSESEGQTESDSWQDGSNTSNSRSTSEQVQREVLRNIVTSAHSDVSGSSSSQGGSRGTSRQTGRNWSTQRSRSNSRTRKQTLVPIIRTRQVLSSVTFYTPDEHDRKAAAALASQDTGRAILHVTGKCVYQVGLPLAVDRLSRTPKTLARLEADYQSQLAQLPFYSTLESIFEQREQTIQAMLRHIHQGGAALPTNPEAGPAKLEYEIPTPPDDSALAI